MDESREWPDWWDWELEFTPHLTKRMVDRQFNEAELRTMLADASDYVQMPGGRSIVFTKREGRHWEVIVEPDLADRVLLVITAYPKD
ncbi:MAG: hypothetical protein ABSA16_17650 [Thermoguttaceae bacterium]|jgi:hypothetical protein